MGKQSQDNTHPCYVTDVSTLVDVLSRVSPGRVLVSKVGEMGAGEMPYTDGNRVDGEEMPELLQDILRQWGAVEIRIENIT